MKQMIRVQIFSRMTRASGEGACSPFNSCSIYGTHSANTEEDDDEGVPESVSRTIAYTRRLEAYAAHL